MRMLVEENKLVGSLRSTAIDNFREGNKIRRESLALAKEYAQQDELVSWKDILTYLGAFTLAAGALMVFAISFNIISLLFR